MATILCDELAPLKVNVAVYSTLVCPVSEGLLSSQRTETLATSAPSAYYGLRSEHVCVVPQTLSSSLKILKNNMNSCLVSHEPGLDEAF